MDLNWKRFCWLKFLFVLLLDRGILCYYDARYFKNNAFRVSQQGQRKNNLPSNWIQLYKSLENKHAINSPRVLNSYNVQVRSKQWTRPAISTKKSPATSATRTSTTKLSANQRKPIMNFFYGNNNKRGVELTLKQKLINANNVFPSLNTLFSQSPYPRVVDRLRVNSHLRQQVEGSQTKLKQQSYINNDLDKKDTIRRSPYYGNPYYNSYRYNTWYPYQQQVSMRTFIPQMSYYTRPPYAAPQVYQASIPYSNYRSAMMKKNFIARNSQAITKLSNIRPISINSKKENAKPGYASNRATINVSNNTSPATTTTTTTNTTSVAKNNRTIESVDRTGNETSSHIKNNTLSTASNLKNNLTSPFPSASLNTSNVTKENDTVVLSSSWTKFRPNTTRKANESFPLVKNKLKNESTTTSLNKTTKGAMRRSLHRRHHFHKTPTAGASKRGFLSSPADGGSDFEDELGEFPMEGNAEDDDGSDPFSSFDDDQESKYNLSLD